ncbi:hypothetical protein JDV02_005338 [Purpureocillium takamizusanense]|uniref:Uncharacterized protein n=1 Tax=Purpureocillium takamizusanense TaxID=2060973 RepID=A0A9Q8QGB4_9HYPO|nr:uncharacterized protein JDV02_005338 [Purpureocillium takamizusanense]UNI19123.1 hypothetical protein JDV02_005338 [Purpureocillium takamizusanense]
MSPKRPSIHSIPRTARHFTSLSTTTTSTENRARNHHTTRKKERNTVSACLPALRPAPSFFVFWSLVDPFHLTISFHTRLRHICPRLLAPRTAPHHAPLPILYI